MAWDCARYRNDPAWTAAVAWPIIHSSANFYASMLRRGPDGLWGLHVLPSSGQDEEGGKNAPDFLCALYSARASLYCALQCATTLGHQRPETDQWRSILAEGLAFPRLQLPMGIYATNACTVDGSAMGRQKHPVQLHPLVFGSQSESTESQAAAAYRLQNRLCLDGAQRPRTSRGWTAPALWLSASRLGLREDLAEMLSTESLATLFDPEQISFREDTFSRGLNWYFTTSHGLFLQAVQDACLDDTNGHIRVAGALPESWRGTEWANFRTLDGGCHSGKF